MKDLLGKYLMYWRIRAVFPHIRGRLLDLGCGTNELVAKYKKNSMGIDVYQWGKVDLIVKDSAKLPFKDEDFDTITIIAALNHIPNRPEVLREVYRVLKPNGRFIITMIPPGISRFWHILRRRWDADQRGRGMGPGEVFGFTSKDIRGLLSVAGFSVLFEKKFMFGVNRVTVAEKSRGL